MPVRRTRNGEPYQDPGRRRSRITFLEQVIAADASGQAAQWLPGTPADVTDAEISSIRGTDVIKAGQDVSQVKIVATVRYKAPGRTATMRFQDKAGSVYVIQAVRDIDPGRLVFQELICLLIGSQ